MPVNPVTEITAEKKAKFLEALADTCNITEAAEIVGISRQSIYRHRKSDPEFAEALEEARMVGADHLEDIAVDRAKKNSDTLLIFLLKGAKPDKYADRKQITGASGGPFEFKLILTDDAEQDQ